MTIYAIGDIHGHLGKLVEAHALIRADQAMHGGGGDTIVHCGDFVDRGPDSRGVIDYLICCRDLGEPHVLILGNHDEMMLDFLTTDPDREDLFAQTSRWLHPTLGGRQTLASYGIATQRWRSPRRIRQDADAAIPPSHVAFLDDLRTPYREADGFFCHAGIRPGVPLSQQRSHDLIWIREPFLSDHRPHGALIVHGHTPVEAVTHYGNRLNIDTGAGYGRALSAVVIEGSDAWLLTTEGRVSVRHEWP